MEEGLSDDDLWWPQTAQAADFVREKEGQLMSQWKPLPKFLRRPTSAVDHCGAPLEEVFLNFLDDSAPLPWII